MIANDSHPALAAPALSCKSSSNELLPPPDLQAYLAMARTMRPGAEFLGYFIPLRVTALRGGSRCGCGSGRLAFPHQDLNSAARYEGFDLSEAAIDCAGKTSQRNSAISLSVSMARKTMPMPSKTTKTKGFRYTFPYEDNSFDFVLLTSVFPHMVRARHER